ncbi:uncharacterized protein F5891DRAFT_1276434 [Suillus fuscotomentosus]|uniref:Uncharacterized protein n=1 Tax=Suillus fuscotomentosus TaxID=1912939 RepID=A0AAD4EBT8_9AGAM|nr:uncharacterized protein F5891DRAFT_1276434 [Suillus fuscotomentosus]KAG1903262.1 hypothetical protein F5891DRAFT_1276434 [Suillus fuscotomentosus]
MNIISEAFVWNANATAVDTPPEFDEWALSGLTKENCVQIKSLARQGKREISRTQSQASTTARSSSRTSSTSMYLPWPWPWFGLFGMFLFLNDFGLTSRHREYENDAHLVLIQILVHTDLGHHDSSALGDPHMGSISIAPAANESSNIGIPRHSRSTSTSIADRPDILGGI